MLSMESIRERLSALLNASISLDEFEDWLVSSSWNVLRAADPSLRQFVGAIELRLAEHSSGHLDERDLLDEFRALLLHGCVEPIVQAVFISINQPAVFTVTSVLSQADYQFPLSTLLRPQTSPTTRTASGRTIVREPVALAS